VESTVLSVLSVSAIALLAIVTGSVIYLTLIEWQDRRRVDEEKRESRRRR
jgi:hypothetical protein